MVNILPLPPQDKYFILVIKNIKNRLTRDEKCRDKNCRAFPCFNYQG